eukprot:scaffold663_cov358-Prasinococcus_capsulatus_cf.AAC.1
MATTAETLLIPSLERPSESSQNVAPGRAVRPTRYTKTRTDLGRGTCHFEIASVPSARRPMRARVPPAARRADPGRVDAAPVFNPFVGAHGCQWVRSRSPRRPGLCPPPRVARGARWCGSSLEWQRRRLTWRDVPKRVGMDESVLWPRLHQGRGRRRHGGGPGGPNGRRLMPYL